MVEENTLSKNKKAPELTPSPELLETLEKCRSTYGQSVELVVHAYNLAIRDKFSPPQAKAFLLAELPFLSERTIRAALPDEAKDQSKVRQPPQHKPSNTKQNHAANLPQNSDPKVEEVENITESQDEIPPEMEETALKYSPSFKEEDVDMNTVTFTMNARDGREFFKKEMAEFVDKIGKRLPGLANRGWRWLNVEVTLKVKPK